MNTQAGISRQVGISKQTFLTFGTYLLLILLHSVTFYYGLAAVVSVILLQGIVFPLLPVLTKHVDSKAVPYVSTIFTVVISTLLYWIFSVLPVNGLIRTGTLFPDPVYLLILVPLLLNQAQYPKSYKPVPTAKNLTIFTVMMICVSSIREILGSGTFMGQRIIPQDSIPIPFLLHVSGAAFLLLALTLLSLYAYRTVSGTPLVLAVLQESDTSDIQPVLCRQTEIDHLISGLFSLIVSLPVVLGLYVLTVIVPVSYFKFSLLLILSVAFQGVTALILYLLSGKSRPHVLRLFNLPWYFPVQTAAVLLPFSFDLAKIAAERGIFGVGVVLFLCLSCSLFLIGCLLLFFRSVKRKLLFGKRPALLTGLPLYLLFAGLGFLVLSGFTAIPYILIAY